MSMQHKILTRYRARIAPVDKWALCIIALEVAGMLAIALLVGGMI